MRHGSIDGSSLYLAIRTVTAASSSVSAVDFCLVADVASSSGSIQFLLPSAADQMGRILVFKRTIAPTARRLILVPFGTDRIDNSVSFSSGTNNFSVTIISNGTNWYII